MGWVVPSSVSDEVYHVAVKVTCTYSSGKALPGANVSYSHSVVGSIDRILPAQFGPLVPSSNRYYPGDAIVVTFNEDIDCSLPYKFTPRLTLANPTTSASLVVVGANLTTVCDTRQIFFDIASPVLPQVSLSFDFWIHSRF